MTSSQIEEEHFGFCARSICIIVAHPTSCHSPTDSMPVTNQGYKRKVVRQALIFALLGWPVADLAVVVGLLISGTAHASTSDWLRMLFQVGLIGVLAGLSVWALYRLTRSTLKL
jgi:hypothetical protein